MIKEVTEEINMVVLSKRRLNTNQFGERNYASEL